MIRKLLVVLLLLVSTAAIAQEKEVKREVLTEAQYYMLWQMTRMQADLLELNEHEYIQLLAVNRKIMLEFWKGQPLDHPRKTTGQVRMESKLK